MSTTVDKGVLMVRVIQITVAAAAGLGAVLLVLWGVGVASAPEALLDSRLAGVIVFLGVTALCLASLVALSMHHRSRAPASPARSRVR
ncbi:MAG: hypothetical protein QM626_12075 [Microbacterium sp.]|uniref:hypothetical protein n=1 Tax=Microbacterium sp. TaxID=51671 RepID=UPI0039E67D15